MKEELTNEAYFNGGRKSPWLMVAYGMIGASVSGVSFVSVPGMVMGQDMTYLQMCIGFIFGYIAVAYILLPLFYRLKAVTIYEALDGDESYTAERRVASLFYLLSDMLGSAVRFYLACSILQTFVFDRLGLTFLWSVPLMVLIMWLYTQKSGIRTLVYTDVVMTTAMLIALGGILLSLSEVFPLVLSSTHLRTFEFTDFVSKQHFAKQFLSGIFIVIVMTGLNQTMMQKNLTCSTLRNAQKDMIFSGFCFVPVNVLFLLLGVALICYMQVHDVALPERGDNLLPMFISQFASWPIALLFIAGIVTAAFSSADSSIVTLTTSFCVDILQRPESVRTRQLSHIGVAVTYVSIVYLLHYVGTQSLINTVYVLASYTYGPLLGLFMCRMIGVKSSQRGFALLLAACTISPVLCYLFNQWTTLHFDYSFGYELLLINALLTTLLVTICRKISVPL